MQKIILFALILLFCQTLIGQRLDSLINRTDERVLNNCNQKMDKEVHVDKRPGLSNWHEIAMEMVKSDLYKICQDAGICGSVCIKFLVDEGGKCLCHIVTREEHPFYTVIYLDLISIMKFTPGEKNGVLQKGWTEEIKFRVPCGIN